jgi:hypothetical protein
LRARSLRHAISLPKCESLWHASCWEGTRMRSGILYPQYMGWEMGQLDDESGVSGKKALDAAMATYALLQSLMVNLVEKGALSLTEGAAVIERASLTLRQRCDGFEAAAAILDEQAKMWRPMSLH